MNHHYIMCLRAQTDNNTRASSWNTRVLEHEHAIGAIHFRVTQHPNTTKYVTHHTTKSRGEYYLFKDAVITRCLASAAVYTLIQGQIFIQTHTKYRYRHLTVCTNTSNQLQIQLSKDIHKAVPDGSVSNIHSLIHLVILQSLGDTTFFKRAL